MSDLLQTLIADGEHFAEHELPTLSQIARMFKPLLARLEAEVPALAERELSSLLGSSAAPAAIENPPAAASAAPGPTVVPSGAPADTAIVTDPAQPAPAATDPALTPVQRAAQLRQEADALDPEKAPAETPAARLRREADEAEAEAIQAEATAGTAAGAPGGAVVTSGGVAQPAQDSSTVQP